MLESRHGRYSLEFRVFLLRSGFLDIYKASIIFLKMTLKMTLENLLLELGKEFSIWFIKIKALFEILDLLEALKLQYNVQKTLKP